MRGQVLLGYGAIAAKAIALEDLAALTKAKAIFKDLGIQLESVDLSYLGRAKKVRIDAENTVVTEGAGDKKTIEGRCEMIRREIGLTDSEYDREKLQERLGPSWPRRCAGATEGVSAATETEMKEL